MTYNFGASTFSNALTLNGGSAFKNPGRMEIELTSSGRFGVEVSGQDTDYIEIAQRPNAHGGWHTFDFKHGGEFGAGVPNGMYYITLWSLDDVELRARAGQLWYDE